MFLGVYDFNLIVVYALHAMLCGSIGIMKENTANIRFLLHSNSCRNFTNAFVFSLPFDASEKYRCIASKMQPTVQDKN